MDSTNAWGVQVDLAQRLRGRDAHVVDHGVDGKLVADFAQDFFGAPGVGQVTGVQITGKIDVRGVARNTDHVTAHVGQPLRKRPAYAFGGARNEHAFVLHGWKPRSLFSVSKTGA
ncbi:hypothetical protein G6F59_017097 [Rhizopus arrhizus]|nr:hypothetical protein G6F59_017097 [Rhizopus arrhizus]